MFGCGWLGCLPTGSFNSAIRPCTGPWFAPRDRLKHWPPEKAIERCDDRGHVGKLGTPRTAHECCPSDLLLRVVSKLVGQRETFAGVSTPPRVNVAATASRTVSPSNIRDSAKKGAPGTLEVVDAMSKASPAVVVVPRPEDEARLKASSENVRSELRVQSNWSVSSPLNYHIQIDVDHVDDHDRPARRDPSPSFSLVRTQAPERGSAWPGGPTRTPPSASISNSNVSDRRTCSADIALGCGSASAPGRRVWTRAVRDAAALKLTDAQFAIAREFSFAGWRDASAGHGAGCGAGGDSPSAVQPSTRICTRCTSIADRRCGSGRHGAGRR